MKLGIVKGNIVSTRKNGNLKGLKLLIVSLLNEELKDTDKSVVCVDTVNAGEGDVVIICSSSSARMTELTKNVATDYSIVGIVDLVSVNNEFIYKKSN
ncbi:EutN/CcmL family microcompartment protein [Rosettibacter firmus]|uniref:EutN/CcmL family microcompartment protein n=1 Tax=Rosettibacter firmus TaxID=3111522 RepID=UPI00336C1094